MEDHGSPVPLVLFVLGREGRVSGRPLSLNRSLSLLGLILTDSRGLGRTPSPSRRTSSSSIQLFYSGSHIGRRIVSRRSRRVSK